MGDFRKPRCRTGRPNVVTKSPGAILDNAKGVGPQGRGQDARVNRRDARERRSKVDVEKATDGFFNRLLAFEDQVALVHEVLEPLIEDDIATPARIELRTMQS